MSEIKVPPKPQYCSTLRSILQNDEYKDLTLKVGNQSLKVHSSFLAEQSSEFAALVAKQINHVVEIIDFTFEQIQWLIKFIYDTIDNVDENVEQIYPAAEQVAQFNIKIDLLNFNSVKFQFKLTRLMKICERTLHARALEIPNTLRILKLFQNNYRMAKKIVQFIKK